jgi:hypothetical protein
MSTEDRAAVIEAMFEGILAAFYATAMEDNDQFSDCHTFAHAALASLEASGFEVRKRA